MAENEVGLFKGHQYITLETYRKTGTPVRTPVWFAQEGDTLYVWTFAATGKARRIRGNPRVKVAPADRTGNPLGPFVEGQAQVNPSDTPIYHYGNQLMDRKYGLLKKAFGMLGNKRSDERVIIKIEL